MLPDCNTSRDRLLADPECASKEEHLRECVDCQVWWARARRVSESITSLPRIPVPAELASAVEATLAEGRSQDGPDSLVERALRSLPRVPAPAILDDLVLDPSPLYTGTTAQLLTGLSRVRTPNVLERLVQEELEAPARHRVERFVGDLERPTVPAALDESPLPQLRPNRGLRSFLAPVAAIAAGLVLWGNLGTRDHQPESIDYGFDVVRVTSPEQLSPLAQSILGGLTTGSRLTPSSEKGRAQ